MEKFRQVSKVTTKLASLASEETSREFTNRYNILKELVTSWEKGTKVKVVEDDSVQSDDDFCDEMDDLCLPSTLTSSAISVLSPCNPITSVSLPVSSSSSGNQHVTTEVVTDISSNDTTCAHVTNVLVASEIPIMEETVLGDITPDISNISLPPIMRKRGRPKGRDLTVIGLPAKKCTKRSEKLLPFIKLNSSIKEQMILKMFVDEDVAKRVTTSKSLIEEEEVEVRPEYVPTAVLDENVDVYIVRKFFTSDAWLTIENTVNRMRDHQSYICTVCFRDISEDTSVACDHCLTWCHMKCVGLKVQPKSKYWFCLKCHKEFK